MADPVTLAMIGAAAGAALKPKNPLQGAFLGATAGLTGGAALGAAGIGGAAAAGAAGGAVGGTGLTAAGGALAPGLGASLGGSLGGAAAAGLPTAGLTAAGGVGLTAPTAAATGYGLTAPAAAAAAPIGLGQFFANNPQTSMQGLSAIQGLTTPEQSPMAPAGQVTRGQQRQYESLLNPQFASVQRAQPFSLI